MSKLSAYCPAPVHISLSRACTGLGNGEMQCPATTNQAPKKTLHQTDLEMSRTAERSQGFHDLWPHTPKLNTRNTQSRNEKMRDS